METVLTTPTVYQGPSKKRPLPSFIKKLWFILADESSQEYIFWVDDGQVICIPNAVSFAQMILPRFFKHRNWQSFVRQLNLYGFRKVYQLNLAYDDSLEKRTVWQFKHECFQKECPEKLFDIKRRTTKAFQQQETSSAPASSPPPPLPPSSTPSPPPLTTTLKIEHGTLEQELKIMKHKVEQVDRKRQDLADQVLELSQMLLNQQKTIDNLMQFTMQLRKKNPDLARDDDTQYPITIQRLMNQSLLKENEENISSSTKTQLPPIPDQLNEHSPLNRQYRPELPSISSLIHDTQDTNLSPSPPMKRPKNL